MLVVGGCVVNGDGGFSVSGGWWWCDGNLLVLVRGQFVKVKSLVLI